MPPTIKPAPPTNGQTPPKGARKKRNHTPVRVPLDPNLMYPTATLKACGLGDSRLAHLRQQGDLKPIEFDGQDFYDGAELIENIKRVGVRKGPPERLKKES